MFRLIDWMMALPDDLDEQFLEGVYQFEEEKKMPFVTYVERRGMLEAIEFGLDLKFGQAGRKLFPRIRAVRDATMLRALMRALKKGERLDEIRSRLERAR